MILIDAKWNRTRRSCFDDSRLQALYDRPMSPREVMCREDGDWQRVSVRDRWWVVSRWLIENPEHHHVFRELLARLVDRCADVNPEPPVSLIAEVLRRIPFDADAARAATCAAADATCAAARATYAAACAAADAAYAAARATYAAAYAAADVSRASRAARAAAYAAAHTAAWDALRNDCLELLR